jgi:hypothetical protein
MTGLLDHSPPCPAVLSVDELLAGSKLIHTVQIPAAILTPGLLPGEIDRAANGQLHEAPIAVRIRPLTLATMMLIAQAAREEASLVPLFMIKEAVVEPTLTIEQIRQMHVGLVHYLVGQINLRSGLEASGEMLTTTLQAPLGQTHLLLAKHFGWTPDQVSQLTPAQVAVYLAGIERLMAWDQAGGAA